MENKWLYDGVMSFENPDYESPDSLFYNNPYGVSVYTDWMADYGAVRSGIAPDITNAGGEVMPRPAFPTLDSGMAVGQAIIDNQWANAKGDYLEFVKNYVYGNNKSFDDITPDEQQKLRNYAGHLETYRQHENQKTDLEVAVKNIDNQNETEYFYETLLEMYPDKADAINANLKSGEYSVADMQSSFGKSKPMTNQSGLTDDIFTKQNMGAMWDSFQAGSAGMVSDLGGMLQYWGLESGKDLADWGKAIQQDNTVARDDVQWDWEHLASKEFWMIDAPTALPSMLSLMIPYFGFGRAGGAVYKATNYAKKFRDIERGYRGTVKGATALKGLKRGEAISKSIAGAIGGRQVEALIEAGGTWNQMKELGYTDEQAGMAGRSVYLNNQWLMLSDFGQLAGIYGRLPFRLANNFGNWYRGAGIATGVLAEGYEEVLQAYFQDVGRAVADDKIDDPELVLDVRKLDGESKKAFAIGVLGGGFFEAGGALATRGTRDIDELLEDVYIKYESRKEAKENATEELSEEFSEFLRQASALPALKDRTRILFSDRQLVDTYTEQELIDIGYNPADYADSRIAEDNARYDKEVGGNQYLLSPEAFNYMDNDGNVTVIFGRNASNEAVLEDVSEAVYRRLEQIDPVLYNDIQAWIQRNQEKSSNFQGRELFSKSFVYKYLGVQSQQEENNTGTLDLPADLAERFDEYFINDEGDNIITEIMGIQERESELLQLPEQGTASNLEEPMRVLSRPAVTIKELDGEYDANPSSGLPQIDDFVQWTSNGVDQFDTPKKIVAIQPDSSGRLYALLEGETTGVPLDQVELRQPPATPDQIFITIDNNQGELFSVPEVDPATQEDKPIVKRTVKIKGIADFKLGEQLTIDDVVNKVNEIDKDNASTKNKIQDIKGLDKKHFTRQRIMNMLSQAPQVAESLEPVVGLSVLKEITADLNLPVKNKGKKLEHLISIREFFEDNAEKTEGALIGAMLPKDLIQAVEMESPRVTRHFTNVITDAYRRLLPNGTFEIHLPEGTTKGQRQKILDLMLGADRGLVQLPKGTQYAVNQRVTKKYSGLFTQASYKDGKWSTPNKLVFKGKAEVPPSLVAIMGVDPTLGDTQGQQGLPRVWNKTKKTWEKTNVTYTQQQYQDYIDRAVETGVQEIQDELFSVFDTLGQIKDIENPRKYIEVALNWYSGAVDKSIQVVGASELPSLLDPATAEDAQLLFRTLLGLTSPNQAVDNNFNYAVEIYKHIEEKNGRPTFERSSPGFKSFTKVDGGTMKMPDAIALNIELLYDLKDTQYDGSFRKAIDFLRTIQKPTEVNAVLTNLGRKTRAFDEALDIDGVYGAEMFNFKVGTFVANLLGQSDVATIDLWMSRQINRWLGEPYTNTNAVVSRLFGDNLFAPNSATTKMRDEAGSRQNFLLFRDVIKGIANDQRVTDAIGRKITTMEAQALLWYMEKALYLNQNARSQKPMKESDYGSYAEIRAEQRRNTSLGNQDTTGAKPERREGAYIKGSGRRAFESSISQETEGATLGRIDLNEEFDRDDRLRPYRAFGAKYASEEARRMQEEYDKNYRPQQWKDYLVTWSTQIGKLHPKLPGLFRRFQFYSLKYYNESMADAEPLIKKLQALHKKSDKNEVIRRDYLDIDKGLKNNRYKEIKPLLDKYGMYDDVMRVRKRLEKIAKDKEAVGFDSGYLVDYFPRSVVDHVALKNYLLEYVADQADKDAIAEQIEESATDVQRKLTEEEHVEIIQRVLLGRAQSNTSTPDNLKARKITQINDSANQFYAPTYDALGIYMAQVTEAIAGKRFLGQSRYSVRKQGSQYIVAHKHSGKDATGLKFKNKRDAFDAMKLMVKRHLDVQGIPMLGMQYTIDSFMLRAMDEYQLSPDAEARLRSLLQSYFSRVKGNPLTTNIKNFGYITSMGSIFSAVTQIADVGLSVWRAGDKGLFRIPTGGFRTISALTKAMIYNFGGKKDNQFIARDDYGVDSIAEEIKPQIGSNSILNALQWVFKKVQLERMDRIGKDTTVNATIAKFRALAKNPAKREYSEFIYRLEQTFDKQEIAQIITDLRENNNSELIMLLSYTELLKVQPIGKSEVPVGYLNMPNGRIMYQLKTFLLKRFDVWRDEVAYINKQYAEAEAQGNKLQMANLQKKYWVRLVGLISTLVMAEAGTDEIKDIIAGRETDLTDRMVGNLLKMVGLSKFTFWKAKREGVDSALFGLITPPVASATNDIFIKDGYRIAEKYAKEGSAGVKKHIEKTGLRLYTHIPLVGKHLYWWNEDVWGKRPAKFGIGRGVVIQDKYGSKAEEKKKGFKKGRRTRRKRRSRRR